MRELARELAELAARCVDVAVARWFERRDPGALDRYHGLPLRLLDPLYVPLGFSFNERADEPEPDGSDPMQIEWTISEETFNAILNPDRRSVWFPFRRELALCDAVERVAIVEAIRTFLTRR